jgi:Recombination endonuclease VII
MKEVTVNQRLCIEVICERCGIAFYKRKDHALKNKYHFCSTNCHNCFQQESRKTEEGLKLCSGCNTPKSTDNFYLRANGKSLRARCKDCNETRRKKIYSSTKHREQSLKHQFGMSNNDYKILFNTQEGRCAICLKSESIVDGGTGNPKNLAVDHCHLSGVIRGLLCYKCNLLIGMAQDNTSILHRAINYLNLYILDIDILKSIYNEEFPQVPTSLSIAFKELAGKLIPYMEKIYADSYQI